MYEVISLNDGNDGNDGEYSFYRVRCWNKKIQTKEKNIRELNKYKRMEINKQLEEEKMKVNEMLKERKEKEKIYILR